MVRFFFSLLLVTILFRLNTQAVGPHNSYLNIQQSSMLDTLPPMWEARNNYDLNQNPFDKKDPSIVKEEVEMDSKNNTYILSKKIGEEFYTAPVTMSFNDYLDYKQAKSDKEFMQRMNSMKGNNNFLSFAAGQAGALNPLDKMGLDGDIVGGIFGGAAIDIKPQGYIDFTFGGRGSFTDNPAILPKHRRQWFQPDFTPQINMRVEGGIGDKFRLGWDYNTQSTFDFDNRIKLAYDSEEWSEDEIIKKIEAGDVSLPLNSQLIQGSQRLFGIKTELQFGKLTLTGLVSQQKSKKKELVIENGGLVREFEKAIDDYDENRHFFLTHYNRETYERSLKNLPQINTLFTITKLEVWGTNKNQQETDNLSKIIAFPAIGEVNNEHIGLPEFEAPNPPTHPDLYSGKGLPGFDLITREGANPLFNKLANDGRIRNSTSAKVALQGPDYEMKLGKDFESLRARKLVEGRDYFKHDQLGFISLNRSIETDEVLAFAMEYEFNGVRYQIGEFSDDADSILIVKLLKSSTNDISLPSWDLMMKNVYSIGAYQVQQEDFQLDVVYDDPGKGQKRFLPETNLKGQPLIQVLNLDNLNPNGDPQPDGRFDFVSGLTILPRTGKVIFPVLEPFGSYLKGLIDDPQFKEKYTFPELYTKSKTQTLQSPKGNRFLIKGKYKSDVTADISLGAFNIPRGSVRVSAGGRTLQEGLDYEIDYNIGRIKILNESYLSTGAITISFEDNAAFGFQLKTMLGLRADYAVSKYTNIGATYMHLYERPFTEKVNIGDDPINNRVYGLDFSYEKSAPWLTRWVDRIPGIDTKEESKIKIYAETAFLKPGHSKAIQQGDEEQGTVYIDDFEGSSNGIPIENYQGNWMLASTPEDVFVNNRALFTESKLTDTSLINVNRALLSWYQLLNLDQTTISDTVPNNHYTRRISIEEIFPQLQQDQSQRLRSFLTLDMTFYPDERGPYNFDSPTGFIDYSAGINPNGSLKDPSSRWAGIMTDNTQPDFEKVNYETIEFWMMSPFLYDGASDDNDGYLVFNLGNISEDVMKDSEKFSEHALPTDTTVNNTTTYTRLSKLSSVDPAINGFENNQQSRDRQDVGFDGLSNTEEREFHENYLIQMNDYLDPMPLAQVLNDPSGDDYVALQDPSNDGAGVLQRYKRFSMPDGDSPISTGNLGTVEQFKSFPDQEDIDRDGSLDEIERYYEYRIPVNNDGMGGMELNDYILDKRSGKIINGVETKWYRVKIPLSKPTANFNNIQDFRNIQFLRMYMHGFTKPTTFRVSELEYGRNLWRRFESKMEFGVREDRLTDDADFNLSSVNIDENSDKEPFAYALPLGISRERVQSFSQSIQQNEQSLNLDICNFQDGYGKGIFKELFLDIRRYKTLRMFAHLENSDFTDNVEDGEMKLFIRLGSDYTENYYEYQVPLTYSVESGNSPSSAEYSKELWREENNIELDLQALVNLKKLRPDDDNVAFSEDPNNPGKRYSVKGNPNLGYVKGIMIGVYNDSGEERCIEMWVNELRMTGLDERGGMAAIAQIEAQLADFGNASVAGNYSTIGYGGLDKKVDARSLEDLAQFDASVNLELGKFFNDESGIKIPFYAQYNKTQSTPEFDPYDLDIKLVDKVAAAETQERKDEIEEQAKEIVTSKSYNFTNVHKERKGGDTPMPWDIENVTASYAYSEVDKTTPLIELDNERTYTGSMGYDYSLRPLYIYPFRKLIKKGKYLKIIKDINLNPIPNSYNFNTILERKFSEAKYRFTEPDYSTWYTKRFNWDRNYGLKWDITQSIKFNYNSTAKAVIDEPGGKIDTDEKRDSIITNLKDLGRLKNYNHNLSLSYTLPINKIPILDWVKAKMQYNADYNWSVAALNADSLGNIITNSQKIQYSADLNFQRLYSKSKYLAKIDRGTRSRKRRGSLSSSKKVSKNAKKGSAPKKKGKGIATWEKAFIKPLMLIRSARLSYSESKGTTLPGFTPQSKLLGMNEAFTAPGLEFIAGFQPNLDNYLFESADKGWFTESLFLNSNVLQDYQEQFSAELKLEPTYDFTINLTANKKYTKNHSEKFKLFERGGDFERKVPNDVGSYTISFFSLNTLVGDKDIDELFAKMEDNRETISHRLGTGQHEENPDYTEGYGQLQQDVLIPAFIAAYTDKSPDAVNLNVFNLIPRVNWDVTYNGLSKIDFFANRIKKFTLNHAYSSTMQINSFKTESNFTGVDRLNEQTSNYYSRFEIPSVRINEELSPLVGVTTTLFNDMTFGFDYGKSRSLDLSFISDNKQVLENNSTTISFTFGYLMKDVNIGFLTGNKKKRKSKKKKKKKKETAEDKGDLFGFDELKSTELNDLFDFSVKDDKTGDLQFNLDVSIRDEITKNHLIDLDTDQVTSGSKRISISPSADYSLNKKVNFRVFFDYQSTNPYTTQQFKRINYNGGVTIRLSLE